ncbi:MAG: extracellular solute-binding protein, partial [Actinobacteria bacterium]|nr:extracellular solute-binding protein [Actinomycetota bacterium]
MVLTDGSGFKISIAAVDKDGNPFTFNSRGAVVVKHGNFIAVAGEGFAPSTEAKTWLFSSPRELGALNVDAQGRFSAQYKITRDVRIGDHLAQVTGLGPNGEQRSVTIDVEIQANPGPSPYDPLTQPRNVLVLFAELFTLLAAVGISRRPQDEEERESAARLGVVWPNQTGSGTHINISGGGIARYAAHPEEARRFLEFLASPAAQAQLARNLLAKGADNQGHLVELFRGMSV